uniref:Glycine N-acyltransferase-like protein n=1 Tax=Mastacembelus armatus TaxID=205130 RepID=A0A7N8XI85_9TELE
MTMKLNKEQLKMAESQLKKYSPRSQQLSPVYGCLLLYNRVRSDPVKFLVDRWPEFSVIIYKPQQEQVTSCLVIFSKICWFLSPVTDWTRYLCLEINNKNRTCLHHWETLKSVASEKDVPIRKVAVCRKMTLEDVSNSGISVRSLDESHISLVNRAWRFGDNEMSVRMIQNIIVNFPSCCVLDFRVSCCTVLSIALTALMSSSMWEMLSMYPSTSDGYFGASERLLSFHVEPDISMSSRAEWKSFPCLNRSDGKINIGSNMRYAKYN